MTNLKCRSGHIKFKNGMKYSDLLSVYRDIYLTFLEESDQIPEDEEMINILLHTNLVDLEANRKPEGYNRTGEMRLMFPIDDEKPINFYIYSMVKPNEVPEVTKTISGILQKSGLEHTVEYDQLLWTSEEE